MREPKKWDNVFMDMAFAVAQRSKDPSSQCGAVIVAPNNAVISVGFNGPPVCIDDRSFDWLNRSLKYSLVIHAELNAIFFGLMARGSLDGCTLYTNAFPCSKCVIHISAVGIKKVVYGPIQPIVCDMADRECTEAIVKMAGMELRRI